MCEILVPDRDPEPLWDRFSHGRSRFANLENFMDFSLIILGLVSIPIIISEMGIDSIREPEF